MLVLGITGGSGAGKSAACKYLLSRGGSLVDCDKVYASLVDKPSECTVQLANEFGSSVLNADGSLNRRALSDIVFKSGNGDRLTRLNEIAHPFVIAEVKRILGDNDGNGIPYTIIDAPQLFEAGADKLCDRTLFVTANRAMRIERIVTRDGITAQAATRRIDSQLSDEYFESRCDYAIYNNGSEDELKRECYSLLDRLGIKENGTTI